MRAAKQVLMPHEAPGAHASLGAVRCLGRADAADLGVDLGSRALDPRRGASGVLAEYFGEDLGPISTDLGEINLER
jgi:hypothetical protein